jgi:DNA-binding NtrC family response regulator
MLLCGGSTIAPDHLGIGEQEGRSRQVSRPAPPAGGAAPEQPPMEEVAFAPAHPDRVVIEEALRRAGGIVSKAAVELGISRQAFYRRMDQAGIVFERRLKIPR